ncbi:MAG: glycosyltransferase family 39 protein [Bacteroidota bacterium]
MLFALFAVNFIHNWPHHLITNSIFIASGDTTGYYTPIESFVNGTGYGSFCRMPGLLPIYGPLYFLFGNDWGKTLLIIVQFLVSAMSVYFLAKSALLIFKSKPVFYVTFFLYALSSFVSIWDHYGLSDSFSTSFLVFSFYFFVSYFTNARPASLVFSGIFITWSVFIRPINGMLIACMLLIFLIQNKNGLKQFIKGAFLFTIPCIIAISLWTLNNYTTYKRFIPLQGSFSECYGQALTEDHLAVRELIIAWGGDFQEWSVNTEAEWFFSKKGNYRTKNPFSGKTFTSGYNLDSLIWLKMNYDSIHTGIEMDQNKKNEIKNRMIASTGRFVDSYRTERPFSFYFFNRLKFLKRFVFPAQLDDLPFPAFSKMQLYHKVIKIGYLALLNFVSLAGILGIFVSLFRKNFYGIIPLAIIIFVAVILGFVEQRYLVPAYPFLCIYCAFFILLVTNKFSRRKTLPLQ